MKKLIILAIVFLILSGCGYSDPTIFGGEVKIGISFMWWMLRMEIGKGNMEQSNLLGKGKHQEES